MSISSSSSRLAGGFALVLATAALGTAAIAQAASPWAASGRTSQGRTVRMRVAGNKLQLLRFTVELKCHDGSVLVDEESGFQPAPLRGGHFKETQYGSTDTVHFAGHLKGRTAKGTLKVTDRSGKVRCVSPNLRFTAHRK